MIKRYWRELPWDGEGWVRTGDPALAALRQWAASQWRGGHAPIPSGIIWLGSRMLWPLAAAGQVARLARRLHGFAPRAVYADCIRTGASPLEAHVWRSLHATPHPLPAKASALLVARLGNPEEQRLLADKLAAAAALAATGAVFPNLVHRWGSDSPVTLSTEMRSGAPLFIKPRHGHSGRGTFALDHAHSGWRVDGHPVSESDLLARIAGLVRHGELLVQERVSAAPSLADWAGNGRAPVLRLVTARLPNGRPFLHSALMAIGVPGQNPGNFLEGTVFAPIDITTGTAAPGVLLARPADKFHTLPWNGATLEGRSLPDFKAAADAVLRAMIALPGLPAIHWDVIPSEQGPVMLEGNVSGNWILVSLPERDNLAAGSLSRLLTKWRPKA